MEFEFSTQLPMHNRTGVLTIGDSSVYDTLLMAYGWDMIQYKPEKVYTSDVMSRLKSVLNRMAFCILEYNGNADVAADVGMWLLLAHQSQISTCVVDTTNGNVDWPNVFRYASLVLSTRGDMSFLLDAIEQKRHIVDLDSRLKIAFDTVKTARQGVYGEQVRRIGTDDKQ